MPPIEHEDGRLVLWRDTERSPTDQCPFCGANHGHGLGDGHRAAHCVIKGVAVTAPDGTVLDNSHGYVLRTRKEVVA
jgi:hypothetical protein